MQNPFRRLADDVWEVERPLKAPGLRLNHRMTVIRLASGELWVHSPVAFDATLALGLAALGKVRHFVAPNRYHDLYWPEWFKHFPDAAFYCVPGAREDHPELPFENVLSPHARRSWETALPKLLIAGIPRLNEFVFLHRASGTLLVADLVFNIDPVEQNHLGWLFLKMNAAYGRVACSRLFRRLIVDRKAFVESMAELMQWDFDRLVVGHGAVVETGGKQALREAMDWIGSDCLSALAMSA